MTIKGRSLMLGKQTIRGEVRVRDLSKMQGQESMNDILALCLADLT